MDEKLSLSSSHSPTTKTQKRMLFSIKLGNDKFTKAHILLKETHNSYNPIGLE